jgi:hypothetical protein
MTGITIVRWSEIKETDYDKLTTQEEKDKHRELRKNHNFGPRFHPRFSDAKIVQDKGGIITLEKEVKNVDVAKDIMAHISSWDTTEKFHAEIIKRKK